MAVTDPLALDGHYCLAYHRPTQRSTRPPAVPLFAVSAGLCILSIAHGHTSWLASVGTHTCHLIFPMPSFLKSLFKPSTTRRSQPSGALPPSVNFSPPRTHADLSTDELTALTQLLQERLTSPGGGNRDSVLQAIRDHPQGGEDTMRQLTAVLQGTDLSRDTLRKPYQPVRGSSQGYRGVDVSRQRSRRGRNQDLWAQAVEAASVALGEPILTF